MDKKEHYSRFALISSVVVGSVTGGLVGTIEGIVGGLAIPTSVRMIDDQLDETINYSFGRNENSVYDKIARLTYNYARLTTRLGIHAAVFYRMMEDLHEGGEIVNLGYVISNLISAGYEIGRYIMQKQSSKRDISHGA